MFHYENLPIQYTDIFSVVKKEKFHSKYFDSLVFLFYTSIVGTLEPPWFYVLDQK